MLLLSALAAVGISALAPSGSHSASRASPERAVALPEVHAVPTAEAAAFRILRRPLRRGDAFREIRPGPGPFGANPRLARTLDEPPGGLSAGFVSVVPADGWVCLRVPFAGGAQWWCQTLAAARRGELVMAVRPAGRLRASSQLVIGLVPDGVRAVTIDTAAGRRTVPVRGNVYDAQLYAPRTISIELPGHRTRRYAAP